MAIDKSYYTIITDVGKAKIANASVTGNKVGFVKIQLGDGGGSEYTPTESQTALKNVVWEGNIGNTTTDETAPNCIILESLIPSNVGGFMIREIGYLDDENNLIAISKYKECYKPSIEQGAVVDMKVKTVLIVSNVNNIELKIDPTIIFATLKDIQDLETKIDTTKTELNTRIDTENEKQNIKIDQLIAGGSNVASTQTITIDDWVEDAENGFKATVTHSLLTQRIVVNIIDATTKENVVTNFKIIDDNSIEVRSETRSELNVYVINGNAETHFINATVDDNRVSEMTTYSSKKIEDRFLNLEEKVNGGLSSIATSVNELITYC
ncbi:TPA: phage tail protein [Clostridioides difficile]|uniref:phage tail protein n=2 Tax=Clostridioides difficile TaxID=1496 RepID=UPI0007BB4406|nr:phage tail protein [Clostridioides difficile]AXU84470.1 phage tail fiber protein [Clostridioides difficile]EJA6666498.1 phage tail protein [Clostridioides difficile]MBH6986324.1 phage tail protein [Clostridioides difficile]MBH7449911.1 phage tail protein [Clostridioides difficile]MBH7593077.1 phage tail protein [Clostridioides difficile]